MCLYRQKQNVSLCVGRSKGKAEIQMQCIPEKRDKSVASQESGSFELFDPLIPIS